MFKQIDRIVIQFKRNPYKFLDVERQEVNLLYSAFFKNISGTSQYPDQNDL